ncbi:hypothetical protein [Myxococcus xanthus]|uniref:Apea-like HEPN domain-containing protein n=1 Tax=Myxococcus xanthus TaxID=34 RepID=A0A7Y4IMJ5_MYXXA|nr:hypothetical protein [Myxococcus xanthus]NOJ81605.1 hypothetical protein [Myxococcus xanthus]NOJ89039.1 hypothetical protein [Myxococcus xanthus]
MRFTYKLQCELPFTLCLPNETFHVALGDGPTFSLGVNNETYSLRFISNGKMSTAFASREMLLANFPDLQTHDFSEKMRTVVFHEEHEDIDEASLPALDNLVECMEEDLVKQGARYDAPTALAADAKQRLADLSGPELTEFKLRHQQLFHARPKRLPLASDFLRATNRLIRHYMVEVDDPFVEEIGLGHLALTTMLGIFIEFSVDGLVLESAPFVDKVPLVLKRPWRPITLENTLSIHKGVGAPASPDFARVLLRRAENLVERTAYRNAIAEAAAALEIVVAKSIQRAMASQGKSQSEIDTELDSTKFDFQKRAKTQLKNWRGKGASDLDPSLWTQIVSDRRNHRNAIVHSDREPSETDARDVVARFRRMAELILAL